MPERHPEARTSYCVICRHRDDGTIRVVGPFESQDAAVGWAQYMRVENQGWHYTPDVLMSNTRVPPDANDKGD